MELELLIDQWESLKEYVFCYQKYTHATNTYLNEKLLVVWLT